jgi:hypothetical protein
MSDDLLNELKADFPLYAEECLRIVNKDAQIVPFKLNPGQLELDKLLEAQRAAGKPRRCLVLKARQLGFSTYAQGKLIHEATLNENRNALVVAHDVKTGDKLYRMGETMYGQLPEDRTIKPPTRTYRRGRFLHFAPPGADAWQRGDIFPNSTYFVDTAGEFEAGRGGTYHLAHLSEFAFWERPLEKLTALLQGVPDTPDSLLIVESTANGLNLFADLWKDAEEGKNDFVPFFWGWWRDPSYSLAFANEREHDLFKQELGRGAYGEDEPDLIKLLEGEGFTEREIHEKLHWRRRTIANKLAGNLDKFRQEYPSTPEEAFVTSGRQVFDHNLVRQVLAACDSTDPRVPTAENPGPTLGAFKPSGLTYVLDRSGEDTIQKPTGALWVPREDALQSDLFRLWVPPEVDPDGRYVIGVDVSGGEMDEGASTPAYHAVQIIDHRTREQVAEYRSHIDPNALAKLIYLAALHFNEAWVAVEITGGWGLPVIRRIYLDYHYPMVYIRRPHERTSEKTTNLLGWHTTTATKPLIEAHGAEMLRDGSHGIKSRDLALEMLSYVKDEKGKSGPEPGRFSDLLIAWLIAQQVATEMPILRKRRGQQGFYDDYAG